MSLSLRLSQLRTLQSNDSVHTSHFGDKSYELKDKYLSFTLGSQPDNSLMVNVSGRNFEIPFSLLHKHRNWLLTKYLEAFDFTLNHEGVIFLDRDPQLFKHLLDFLDTGMVVSLDDETKKQFLEEASFFNLNEVVEAHQDDCRYPIEQIGAENIKLKRMEDNLRKLFVKDRTNQQLSDPHLLLSPLFPLTSSSTDPEGHFTIPNCPKLLNLTDNTTYVNPVQPFKIVENQERFEQNWKEFTNGILDGLDKSHVFAAGGSVLTCLDENRAPQSVTDPNSDIDLFLYGLSNQQAEDKLRHIYEIIKKNCNGDVFVVRTKFAITFYTDNARPVQVVLRIYKSPAEVLLGFDICCACVGWDGKIVWANQRARRAMAYQTNLIDPDRMSTTYEYRLYKYAKRGFSVSVPGYSPNLVRFSNLIDATNNFKVKNFPVAGLARLIIYDLASRNAQVSDMLKEHEANMEEKKKHSIIRQLNAAQSDYSALQIPKKKGTPVQHLYTRLKKQCEYFTELNSKSNPNWKPYYVYSMNDIEGCIYDNDRSSNLGQRIEWVTINPGSQRVGSFQPVTSNFYRDAYKGVVIPEAISIKRIKRNPTFSIRSLFKPLIVGVAIGTVLSYFDK